MGKWQLPMRGMLLCFMLVLALSACGRDGDSSRSLERHGPEAGQLSLTGLPPVGSLHFSAAAFDDVRLGVETSKRSNNATDSGTALLLAASADEMSFGTWTFNAGGRALTSLSFDFDIQPDNEVWVAIADFSSNRWTMQGPFTDDMVFPLDDQLHRSPEGNVVCTALTFGSTALVNTITLTTDTGGNLPPTAALAADSSEGVVPMLVNFDASSSIDGDSAEMTFEWDFDNDGLFSETGPELDQKGLMFTQYTFTEPGFLTVTVKATDDGGLSDTESRVISVLPDNTLPQAVLIADPQSGAAPLLVSFSATSSIDSDGSIADYAWDFDNDGKFGEAGREQDSAGQGQVSETYFAAGSYQVAVKVTDNDGGVDTASTVVEVSGNLAPVADIQANKTEGNPTLSVNFSASASSDPDGSIAGYSWDLDDDGVFNSSPAEQTAEGSASASASYAQSGAYYAKVRVTDNIGATDVAKIKVKVYGWALVTVDTFDLFAGTSLALINGRPAIAYGLVGDGEIRYAISSTVDGAHPDDWSVVTVDNESGSWSNSLALIDGHPAIAYGMTISPGRLNYAVASSSDGASAADWTQVVVDASNDTGFFPSLADINGQPSIAYFSRGNATFEYARSSSASGSSSADWSSIVIGNGTGYDDSASLRLVDGKPAVAYYSGTDAVLQFAFSSSSSGALLSDWSSIVIDNGSGFVGSWCNLALIGGKPAIAYVDLGTDENLKYAISSSAGGTIPGNWTKVLVDGAHNVYNGVSVGQVNGKPAISYFDGDSTVLRLAESSSASGTLPIDWSNSVADGTDYCGEDSSLLEVDGCPAISYFYDGLVQTQLRFAIRLQ